MEYRLPDRIENSNKSTYGRVLNIAGSDYMPGAAYLSSVSALKVGCGYCFLASSERVIDAVAAQTQNIVFAPLRDMKSYIETADVISIGCGLGQNSSSEAVFSDFLRYTPMNKQIVIDADGLNLISKDCHRFINFGFENVVFTPHPLEAARLLDCSLEDILRDISGGACKITNKFNCVTVLKSHNTFVCSPDGRKYINNTGNNSMAKAGSGDVLTGMIAGLIAQGMDNFEAASLGVYLHGLSGDLAAKKLTEYSVMPEDLISFIPEAIKHYLNS